MDRENCCPASTGNCEIIKKLQKEKRTLPRIAWITYFVALLIAICFVIRTFWPNKMCIPESISINIVDAHGQGKELSAEGKAYLKEQLHTALMEVSARAETAYHEKFASLLTVLTIFGIAWPVVIGLLQFRFNERELKKIQDTEDKIKVVEQAAKDAISRADSATEAASNAHSSMIDNQIILKELEDLKTDLYNSSPFIYQSLASFFSIKRNQSKSNGNKKSYLKYLILELEMGLKGLYYACLANDSEIITDLANKVLHHFGILEKYMEDEKIENKPAMKHIFLDWSVIEKKVESTIFNKIKDIYEKRFSERKAGEI